TDRKTRGATADISEENAGHYGTPRLPRDHKPPSALLFPRLNRSLSPLSVIRIDVEPRNPAFEPWACGRIARQHQRIVARDHVTRRGSQPPECGVALDHLAHIVGDRKNPASVDVSIEMRRVRREHHVPAPGL